VREVESKVTGSLTKSTTMKAVGDERHFGGEDLQAGN
jgi:hypothetical protein